MPKKVVKRDGRVVRFEKNKITNAIFKAAQAVGGSDKKISERLTKIIVEEITKKFPRKTPTVEQIQDIVEKVLIENGHAKTAKAYILYREKRRILREYKESMLGKGVKTKLPINAVRLLKEKFLKKNEKGKILETPDEMFRRVAKNIAKADLLYKNTDSRKTEKEFYELMASLDFLPNAPALMNAGTKIQQLVSSFVLPIDDSIDGIFESVKNTALIHKTAAGTGFSFSSLRPENDIVVSTSGLSSGPVSFMTMFDRTTEIIKEGGKKRGANIAIMNYDHPDIAKFISFKDNEEMLVNFNLSVGIDKKFIEAYEKKKIYPLINPRNNNAVGYVSAREVFKLLAMRAWKNGDPGVIFLDKINKKNPTPGLGKFEATDPCAAQPLLPYESCPLGAINLTNMVENGKINYEKLKYTARKAVHFLDNIIDVNNYPLKESEEISRANRKIGLGVMGFADMLYLLGIAYDSDECVKLASKLMLFIDKEAKNMSAELAKKRGVFPNFKNSIYYKKKKMRNATVTTISPTGTISILADVSPSIEPNFALCLVRKVMESHKFYFVNKFFEKIAKAEGFYSELLLEKIKNKASVLDIKEIPKKIKKIFALAHDIKPEWQIKVQAAFQKHVDNGVSKTINFPKSATLEDVEKAFLLAYKLGCKGVTIYREGSKEEEIIDLVD